VNDPERSHPGGWNFFLRIFPQSSHRVAAFGAALGLGSPAGLFLLRFIFSPSASSWPVWAADEIAKLWPVYAYAALGTVAAFSVFGYFLGRGYDAYRGESRALRQMARNLRRLAITDGLLRPLFLSWKYIEITKKLLPFRPKYVVVNQKKSEETVWSAYS
jgi:hypothetical protein